MHEIEEDSHFNRHSSKTCKWMPPKKLTAKTGYWKLTVKNTKTKRKLGLSLKIGFASKTGVDWVMPRSPHWVVQTTVKRENVSKFDPPIKKLEKTTHGNFLSRKRAKKCAHNTKPSFSGDSTEEFHRCSGEHHFLGKWNRTPECERKSTVVCVVSRQCFVSAGEWQSKFVSWPWCCWCWGWK